MLTTCTCGKKLVFGNDPNEEQLCDRCGQRVMSPLSGEERAPAGTPAPKRSAGSSMPQAKDMPHRFEASPMSSRLFKQKPRKEGTVAGKIGCVAIVLCIIAVPLGIEWYRDPYGAMKCGHTGKESLFTLIPLHSCRRLDAVRYLNMVRREMQSRDAKGTGAVGTIEALDIGAPVDTPYKFEFVADGYLAFPKDAASDLPSFFLAEDGSVHMSLQYEATAKEPKTGQFGD